MRSAVAALVLALSTPLPKASADPVNAASLVGTWRLVRFEDVQNGRTLHEYGEQPKGLFIYTADGHVAIQIANPGNPVCIRRYDERDGIALPVCTPAQREALMAGYVAYWGTYTVDAAAGVVVHHVESDFGIGYTGTDQRRPFRLDGDTLTLGDGKTWTRVLERVR